MNNSLLKDNLTRWDSSALSEWIINQLSIILDMQPDVIDENKPFSDYISQSSDALILSGKLESILGVTLPQNIFWHYNTIHSLSIYLAEEWQGENSASDGAAVEDRNTLSMDEIPVQFYEFKEDVEYKKLQALSDQYNGLTERKPFFTVHEKTLRDVTFIDGKKYLSFSGYNYLGLTGDPRINHAARESIDLYGTSVCASRLASGEKPIHRELEKQIADLIGSEDSIVYVAGHATNVSTIGCFCGEKDLILYDALIHDSAIQGAKLSGARCIPFNHNDCEALESFLQDLRKRYEKILILLEGVYSMDGDIPDLPRVIELKKKYKAYLLVDEAHSIGVLGKQGKGIGEYHKVSPQDVDLWMGTLSKTFASCGGYIAAKKEIIDFLKYFSPGFVYSVGISPPNAAAALEAIKILKSEPERVEQLHKISKFFLDYAQAEGLNTGKSQDSAIIPVIVGDSGECIKLADRLFEAGINVQPMIYPAVENNAARLRFFITSLHTEEQVRYTIDTLKRECNRKMQY